MADANKMITRAECNALAPGAFTGELNRCPTKAEIVATGKFIISGSYSNNQLVKYGDVSLSTPTLSISPTMQTMVIAGGSFTLNITCNTSWKIAYPSWCSGTTSGTGNASIRVTVTSNTGNSRSGSITVTTTAPSGNVSKTCAVSQNGKPTINIGAYGIDLSRKTMDVAASSVVLDDLDIFVHIWNSSSLITASGSGTLRKGLRSVLINLSGSLPNDGNFTGYISSVNGTHVSPYETSNAIYTFITHDNIPGPIL